ncbi:hypothetical protein AVEN_174099-1 [Araneus ventricosus]|uniref:Uncharacterized protein n=1 Tax=Araneus ventricosus TaxID=182803 RepID=A0A4Y2C1G4_ARAVE|nr:hypothetical protein AVEN_174099-1 [Araneus ventricosus]
MGCGASKSANARNDSSIDEVEAVTTSVTQIRDMAPAEVADTGVIKISTSVCFGSNDGAHDGDDVHGGGHDVHHDDGRDDGHGDDRDDGHDDDRGDGHDVRDDHDDGGRDDRGDDVSRL